MVDFSELIKEAIQFVGRSKDIDIVIFRDVDVDIMGGPVDFMAVLHQGVCMYEYCPYRSDLGGTVADGVYTYKIGVTGYHSELGRHFTLVQDCLVKVVTHEGETQVLESGVDFTHGHVSYIPMGSICGDFDKFMTAVKDAMVISGKNRVEVTSVAYADVKEMSAKKQEPSAPAAQKPRQQKPQADADPKAQPPQKKAGKKAGSKGKAKPRKKP